MAKTLELNWSEVLSDAVREAAHLYDRRILTIGCCAFAIETSSGRLSFSRGTEQRVLMLLSFDDAEQDAIGEPGAVGVAAGGVDQRGDVGAVLRAKG